VTDLLVHSTNSLYIIYNVDCNRPTGEKTPKVVSEGINTLYDRHLLELRILFISYDDWGWMIWKII
jgi:hypothetical protein